jgi:hypothetical protein
LAGLQLVLANPRREGDRIAAMTFVGATMRRADVRKKIKAKEREGREHEELDFEKGLSLGTKRKKR